MADANIPEKRCLACGTLKPLTAFRPHKMSKSGSYSSCKACCNEKARNERRLRREALPPVVFEDLPGERWCPVVGHEERHEVSTVGRVRRICYVAVGQGALLPPKILSTPVDSSGYPALTLTRDGVERHYRVHELVMAAFIGPRPEGLVINHKDADRLNNCVENLEYCTQAENVKHAVGLGRIAAGDRHGSRTHPEAVLRGEAHWGAVLTEEKVREARQMQAAGFSLREIASKFGVHVETMRSVLKIETWRHVI